MFMTSSSSPSFKLSLLIAAVVVASIATATTTAQQAATPAAPANREQQTPLCNNPGTLIWKIDAGSRVFASAAVYTPPSLPDASGESTYVLFGTTGLPRQPNTARFFSVKALYPDITWQSVLADGVFAGATIGGPLGSTVYFGSDDNNLYALDADSNIREWSYASPNSIEAQPLYTHKRKVYVGDTGGVLSCLDADASGKKLWSKTLGDGGAIYDRPLYYAYFLWEQIFVGNNDGSFYALHPDTGTQKWTAKHKGGIASTPCVVEPLLQPSVAVTDKAGYCTVYDMSSGKVKWQVQPSGAEDQLTSPIAGKVLMKDKNGNSVLETIVFYGSSDGKVYALFGANGTLAWSHTTGGPVASAPFISTGERFSRSANPPPPMHQLKNKFVYVGSDDGNIYQLDAATGKRLWNYTAGGKIVAQPVLDTATGLLFFGALDYKFYSILAEPTCLPSCGVPAGSANFADNISNVIVTGPLARSADVNGEGGDLNRYQGMPGVPGWTSASQSIVYHPITLEDDDVSAGAASKSTTVFGASSDEDTSIENRFYSFWVQRFVMPIDSLVDALNKAAPGFASASNSAEAANEAGSTSRQQKCTWTLGCLSIMPCVQPALPAKTAGTNYTVAELTTFYDSAALHALFEFAVAVVTTRNRTLAQHIFSNRVTQAKIASNFDVSGNSDAFLARANEIANAAELGFVCAPDSRMPHVYLTSGNFTFDATSYAQAYDSSSGGDILGRSALNALGGGHTFLASTACSSCAPYFSADNNAVPWLFLIVACIKTAFVSFKLVPLVAAVRRYFLRRRTHGDLIETGDSKDKTKQQQQGGAVGAGVAVSGTRDPVAVLRAAQGLRSNILKQKKTGGGGGADGKQQNKNNDDDYDDGDDLSRFNSTVDKNQQQQQQAGAEGGNQQQHAAGDDSSSSSSSGAVVFHGLAEVRRRVQKCVGLDTHVGNDFVRFYLSQFSSPSISFESSTVATPWDRETRREKILDVVVPNAQYVQQVNKILAPLDQCFEEVLDERYQETTAREAQSFGGKMSNFLRFSTAGGTTASGYSRMGDSTAAKEPLLGGSTAGGDPRGSKARRSMNSGIPSGSSLGRFDSQTKGGGVGGGGGGGTYGATAGDMGADDDDGVVAQPQAYNYDYNEQQKEGSSSADAAAVDGKKGGSEQQQAIRNNNNNNNEQQKLQPTQGGSNKAGISLREIRSALRNFRASMQEHPEWFEIITVVSHRLPKNPFLPSRLILALGTIYAVIYYIVSLVDALTWTDQALSLTHQDGDGIQNSLVQSAPWQRYESFGWRIMNSTIFPLLFINCILAHSQYMMATTSETGNILKQLRGKKNNAGGNNNNNNSGTDADEAQQQQQQQESHGCLGYTKSLLQHFEGRVAVALVLMTSPMILTHILPVVVLYCWMLLPIFFFFIVTPIVLIAAYSRWIMYEEQEAQAQQQLRNQAALDVATNNQSADTAVGYGVYANQSEPGAWAAFCGAVSLRDEGNRRRLAVYVAYCCVYFFMCTLVSWSFNVGAMTIMYRGDGTIHFVDPSDSNRYAQSIGWDMESRSPVCGTVAFFWSASSSMRNLALFLTPF